MGPQLCAATHLWIEVTPARAAILLTLLLLPAELPAAHPATSTSSDRREQLLNRQEELRAELGCVERQLAALHLSGRNRPSDSPAGRLRRLLDAEPECLRLYNDAVLACKAVERRAIAGRDLPAVAREIEADLTVRQLRAQLQIMEEELHRPPLAGAAWAKGLQSARDDTRRRLDDAVAEIRERVTHNTLSFYHQLRNSVETQLAEIRQRIARAQVDLAEANDLQFLQAHLQAEWDAIQQRLSDPQP